MKKKFQLNDKVLYGTLTGIVKNIDNKNKWIECIFFEGEKEICILFDYDGDLIPTGKFLDLPRLEKI